MTMEAEKTNCTGEDPQEDESSPCTLKENDDFQKPSSDTVDTALEDKGSVNVESEKTVDQIDEAQKESSCTSGDIDEDTEGKDDDEIEENPAYIPKKGRYYMHDSRDDDGQDLKASRKSRADCHWKHDRFDEKSQRPKTKQQLLNKYGFDIREGERGSSDERSDEKEIVVENVESEVSPPVRRSGKKGRGGFSVPVKATVPPKGRKPKPAKGSLVGSEVEHKFSEPRRKDFVRKSTEKQRKSESGDDGEGEQAFERRQKPQMRVIRNVRGRGAMSTVPTRGGRGFQRGRANHGGDRRDNSDYRPERRENFEDRSERKVQEVEREFENHRRGATRGSVRGGSLRFNSGRGQFTRTFNNRSEESRRDENRRDENRRDENRRDENRREESRREPKPEFNGPSTFERRGTRGNFSNRGSRGMENVRGRGSFSSRGNTSTRGSATFSRGSVGNSSVGAPKRYSQRHDGGNNHSSSTTQQSVNSAHSFIPRQPTDVVYFDPAQQTKRQPPPPREKKIIEIVPPTS